MITTNQQYFQATEALIQYDPLPVELLTQYKLIIDFAEVYHSDKKIASRVRYKALRDSEKYDLHFTQLGTILSKKNISLHTAD